jgi:hypothetical protein
MNAWFLQFFHVLHGNTSTSWKGSTINLWFYLLFICSSLSPVPPAQANEPPIEIVDTWVEDGYIFHVDFEVPPYQVYCQTTGEGYIGFNIYYKDPRSLEDDWIFGLAPWPDGVAHDSLVESHLTAYGSQGFCTRFSPCIIRNVQMVKSWCPIQE